MQTCRCAGRVSLRDKWRPRLLTAVSAHGHGLVEEGLCQYTHTPDSALNFTSPSLRASPSSRKGLTPRATAKSGAFGWTVIMFLFFCLFVCFSPFFLRVSINPSNYVLLSRHAHIRCIFMPRIAQNINTQYKIGERNSFILKKKLFSNKKNVLHCNDADITKHFFTFTLL